MLNKNLNLSEQEIINYINLRLTQESLEEPNNDILEEEKLLKSANENQYKIRIIRLYIEMVSLKELPLFLNKEDCINILSFTKNENIKNLIIEHLETEMIRKKNTYTIKAYDDNNIYDKEITFKIDKKNKEIINIGGYGYYMDTLFIGEDSLLNNNTDKLCIDFMGRNHNGSAVYINVEDLINIENVKSFISQLESDNS